MSRIGRNLVFLLVSQVLTWSVTLVVLVIVPARLGDAAFGKFGFATSFVQYFTLVASLGTSTLLIKLVARDSSVLPSYVFNAVVLKVVLVSVLSVLAIVIAAALDTDRDTMILIVAGCVGMLFVVINEVFVGAQAGLEVMGKPAMWGVVQIYVASIIGLVLVLRGGGVVPYGIAFLLAPAVPMIANGVKVWPWLRGSTRVDPAVWSVLVRGGLPLMVLNALNLVYATIDVPILNQVSGDETVGWYTLAYRYVAIPVFIATAAVTAFFPTFSAHGEQAAVTPEFGRQVDRALKLVMAISIPAAAGLIAVAEGLITLIYDDQYGQSVSLIQILALHIPFAGCGVILGMSLIASDRHHRYLWVAGLAALIAPFSGYVMIKWSMDRWDNGAIGAAINTVVIEVIIVSGAMRLRAPGVMSRSTALFFVRVVLAGTAMAVIVYLVESWPLLVRVAFGAVVYGLAALALRVVSPADVRRVLGQARTMARRGPPPPTDFGADSDAHTT